MGLFKNGVGRPSNETIRKRRTCVAIIVVLVVACGFLLVNYFCFDGSLFGGVGDKYSKSDCEPRIGEYSRKVMFNSNGGTEVKEISICTTCTPENITLPSPVKEGYIFSGWYADKSLTKKAEGGLNTVEGAVWKDNGCYEQVTTLYAKWTKIDDCEPRIGGYSRTVTFNSNGGSAVEKITICVTCTPENITLPTPTKKGYVFEGWYADKELTKKVKGALNDVEGAIWQDNGCYDQVTTLYAKWNKKDDCKPRIGGYSRTVTFNSNGGSSVDKISICVTCAPEDIILPVPTKDGYVFEGWFADKNLTKQVKGGINTVEGAVWKDNGCYDQVTTLYAKWKNKSECRPRAGGYSETVYFNSNGGSKVDKISICVTCAPEEIVLPTPTKSGFTFDGWYANKELTKKVTGGMNKVEGATFSPNGCYNNVTILYAKWK